MVTRSRVSAYVREPHADLIRRSQRAAEQAIQQAAPFLESMGWTELEYQGAQWDDDPQAGKAFYIYFRGVPAGGGTSALMEALDAVDCVAFSPDLPTSWWRRLLHSLEKTTQRLLVIIDVELPRPLAVERAAVYLVVRDRRCQELRQDVRLRAPAHGDGDIFAVASMRDGSLVYGGLAGDRVAFDAPDG